MTTISRFGRDIHYLYPEVVYRFSMQFLAFWETHQLKSADIAEGKNKSSKDAYVIPAFFSKKSRTFQWLGVHSSMWNWENENAKENLVQIIRNLSAWRLENPELWKRFLADMPEELDVYRNSGALLERLTTDYSLQDFEELHRAILTIYSGYHQHAEKNIEGVYYRFLIQCKNSRQRGYLLGELKKDTDDSATFDWFVVNKHCCEHKSCKLLKWQSLHNEKCCGDVKPESMPICNSNPLKAVADGILLKGLLLTPRGPNETENFQKRLESHPFVIITPIHDIVAGEYGYGGIKGVIVLFFKTQISQEAWIHNKYKKLFSATPELAGQISASAEILAGSVPITPPYDLLIHFLKVLIYVQDWEEAVVFKNDQIEYGFKRETPKKSDFKWDWKQFGNEVFNKEPAFGKDGSNRICRNGDKYYLWWTAGQEETISFWSKDLIPGLGEDELSRFKDISIRFEFPTACHIPSETNDLKFFCDTYLRQQIDLMRVLIPKVRSRRAALRSALSAIMGRNLSHNIGSHVLARYSSAVGRMSEQRESEAKGGTEDHRAVFLRYLQRRMDFIAEMATAEKSFWSQPLGLIEILSALNLDNERQRINGKEDSEEKLSFKPILLSYITGKEGMNATVDASDIKDDPYFACPGGEMGAHALYVILENIIRNSARHNSKIEGTLVTVEVKIKEVPDNQDLWCLTLIDCQSELKEESTQKNTIDDINEIITEEPILNQDGSPNPKYWGIREMQICAQYLRSLPMSDLEGFATQPPVLEVFSHINGGGKKCLAYRIYLQRAKLCAVIPAQATMNRAELSSLLEVEKLIKKLKPKGIQILPSISDAAQLQGYSFVVVEDTVTEVIAVTRELEFKDKDGQKRIPQLQLPVRTMRVDTQFMLDRLNELKADNTDIRPEDWLETLHKRMWETYRDNRKEWKNKVVKALVGWDQDKQWDNIIEIGECPPDKLFCHARIADGINMEFAYNNFGDAIRDQKKLGCAWADHATETQFYYNNNPNFISASKRFKGHYRPFIFSEFVESLSPHMPLLSKQALGTAGGNELVAAALARVIVLDERVQNEINRNYRDLDYKLLWPCMGVWVPDAKQELNATEDEPPATDLNQPDFDGIKRFLAKPAQLKDQFPPDFLVLHLTILENLKKHRPEDKCEADTLAALLDGTQANKDCEVVIVTGRGAPSLSRHSGDVNALPARYLPISALLEYLLARPSKLALMRALWSAAAAS